MAQNNIVGSKWAIGFSCNETLWVRIAIDKLYGVGGARRGGSACGRVLIGGNEAGVIRTGDNRSSWLSGPVAVAADHNVVSIISVKDDDDYDDFVFEGVRLQWSEPGARVRGTGPAEILQEGEEYTFDPYGYQEETWEEPDGERVWLDDLQPGQAVAWACWRVVRSDAGKLTFLRSDERVGVSLLLDCDWFVFMRNATQYQGFSVGGFEETLTYSPVWADASLKKLSASAYIGSTRLGRWKLQFDPEGDYLILHNEQTQRAVLLDRDGQVKYRGPDTGGMYMDMAR